MSQRPLRLASWNVNGIRSVAGKGFIKWFESVDADIVSLQETKARQEQLEGHFTEPKGYLPIWHSAEKPGYSGVAIYTRIEPLNVTHGLGSREIDVEGRVLEVEFPQFTLINAYFPNSQREGVRLSYKLKFCARMLERCQELKAKGKNVILCGDYNIAHQEIDLKNPKTNTKNAGFLPEERQWMTQFLSSGFADIFRERNKEPGHYTWWSYRPGVREKNIGWRIDYHCVNEEFRDRVRDVKHLHLVKGSDHCPIVLEIA